MNWILKSLELINLSNAIMEKKLIRYDPKHSPYTKAMIEDDLGGFVKYDDVESQLKAKEEEIEKLKDKWISVDDRLPDLEEVVIVQYGQDSGTDVFWGQRREVAETKRIDGIFQTTGNKVIEWGYDENGEYWNKLNVTYWQPFPEIKK